MKVTKTSVHRLTITKTCGCQATREYEDARHAKPLGEGVFTACEKHEKNKAIIEFAGEMLLEALDTEATNTGRETVVRSSTPTSLSGVTGATVESMGAPNIPKSREKRDPLAPKTASFDRPDMRHPQNTSPTGNLNIAGHDDLSEEQLVEAGITMNGSIDDVPADPNVDAAMGAGFQALEDIFDDEDVKSGGVSQTLINRQAVD